MRARSCSAAASGCHEGPCFLSFLAAVPGLGVFFFFFFFLECSKGRTLSFPDLLEFPSWPGLHTLQVCSSCVRRGEVPGALLALGRVRGAVYHLTSRPALHAVGAQ